MMLSAFWRAKAEGLRPPGDVLLLVLSDEESGGDYGAKYLVEEHAGLFDGVQTVHAADERIPAEALSFGAGASYRALQSLHPRNAIRLPWRHMA